MLKCVFLFFAASSLTLAGCVSAPRPGRAARVEQYQLDRIARIPNPQRRLGMAARVLQEAAAGDNIRIVQEIFNRYPNLAYQPFWPTARDGAIQTATARHNQDIVRAIEAYDARRGGSPNPPPLPKIPPTPAPAVAAPAAVAPTALKSDVDFPDYHGEARGGDFALVVGVEKYSRLPDAKFAERDAQAVARHLLALGFPQRNVISLTGAQATRGALQGYLEEWLPKNVKSGSTVFFYYSGHGAPDPTTGQAYLVPWDGDAMFLQSTAYPVKQLYGDLSKLGAKAVLVALDSCFSGAGGRSVLADGARPLVTKIDKGVVATGGPLAVLTAAGGDEITSTLPEMGHGLFTYFLLKGLSNGKRSAGDLYDFLKPRVQDEAQRQNRAQTPALLGGAASL